MALELQPTYLLPTHLPLDELHNLEDAIPNLTHDISEAKIVLGRLKTKQRAIFELRSRKLWTEEIIAGDDIVQSSEKRGGTPDGTPRKRMRKESSMKSRARTTDLSIESSNEMISDGHNAFDTKLQHPHQDAQYRRIGSALPVPIEGCLDTVSSQTSTTIIPLGQDSNKDSIIRVVQLDWFTESAKSGHLLPLDGYVIYEGRRLVQSDDLKHKTDLIEVRYAQIGSKETY